MPAHIGDVPKYGIDSPEQGIFVESIDFDGQQEIYEQKNNVGKKCGLVIVDEELSFSMSGAVLSTGSSSLKMGGTLALANEIPQIWHTPSHRNHGLPEGGEAQFEEHGRAEDGRERHCLRVRVVFGCLKPE